MSEEQTTRRQLPAWLVGLLIALVLAVVGVLLFQALGFGDNPVLEGMATSRHV